MQGGYNKEKVISSSFLSSTEVVLVLEFHEVHLVNLTYCFY